MDIVTKNPYPWSGIEPCLSNPNPVTLLIQFKCVQKIQAIILMHLRLQTIKKLINIVSIFRIVTQAYISRVKSPPSVRKKTK
jgi:hypothetical protein